MSDTEPAPPPVVRTVEQAFKDLDARLVKLGSDVGIIKRYLGMAELSHTAGDHAVAKRHLKRALDLEFAIGFECEAAGALAQHWYGDEEI